MADTTATSVQPLLDYFNRLIPLNEDEKELVRSKFHSHLFLKKQFALQHGAEYGTPLYHPQGRVACISMAKISR